jgi:hypothetical protein
MDPKIIVIDGKTYHSVEEMPPAIRQKYEQAMQTLGDANSNQIPDAFETTNIFADKDKDGLPDILENIASSQATVSSMKIIVDGKEFNSLEALPPEARARYEEAMGKLDANRNGVPDFAEGMMSQAKKNVMSVSAEGNAASRSNPLPATPTITPDTSNGMMLVLAGLFLVLLCVAGAGAVWYFFLR